MESAARINPRFPYQQRNHDDESTGRMSPNTERRLLEKEQEDEMLKLALERSMNELGPPRSHDAGLGLSSRHGQLNNTNQIEWDMDCESEAEVDTPHQRQRDRGREPRNHGRATERDRGRERHMLDIDRRAQPPSYGRRSSHSPYRANRDRDTRYQLPHNYGPPPARDAYYPHNGYGNDNYRRDVFDPRDVYGMDPYSRDRYADDPYYRDQGFDSYGMDSSNHSAYSHGGGAYGMDPPRHDDYGIDASGHTGYGMDASGHTGYGMDAAGHTGYAMDASGHGMYGHDGHDGYGQGAVIDTARRYLPSSQVHLIEDALRHGGAVAGAGGRSINHRSSAPGPGEYHNLSAQREPQRIRQTGTMSTPMRYMSAPLGEQQPPSRSDLLDYPLPSGLTQMNVQPAGHRGDMLGSSMHSTGSIPRMSQRDRSFSERDLRKTKNMDYNMPSSLDFDSPATVTSPNKRGSSHLPTAVAATAVAVDEASVREEMNQLEKALRVSASENPRETSRESFNLGSNEELRQNLGEHESAQLSSASEFLSKEEIEQIEQALRSSSGASDDARPSEYEPDPQTAKQPALQQKSRAIPKREISDTFIEDKSAYVSKSANISSNKMSEPAIKRNVPIRQVSRHLSGEELELISQAQRDRVAVSKRLSNKDVAMIEKMLPREKGNVNESVTNESFPISPIRTGKTSLPHPAADDFDDADSFADPNDDSFADMTESCDDVTDHSASEEGFATVKSLLQDEQEIESQILALRLQEDETKIDKDETNIQHAEVSIARAPIRDRRGEFKVGAFSCSGPAPRRHPLDSEQADDTERSSEDRFHTNDDVSNSLSSSKDSDKRNNFMRPRNRGFNSFMKSMKRNYNNTKKGRPGRDRGLLLNTDSALIPESVRSHIDAAIEGGIISKCNNRVSVGKSSNVYHADKGPESGGADVAVKVFTRGDPRYWKTSMRNLGNDEQLEIWATTEYRNLIRARKAGVPTPVPLGMKENVIFMRFLGTDGVPAPRLKDIDFRRGGKKWKALFTQMLDALRRLYVGAKLVHGQLNECSALVAPSSLVHDAPMSETGSNEHDFHIALIDFGQTVDSRHPDAKEMLKRDLQTIRSFFIKYGGIRILTVDEMTEYVCKKGSAPEEVEKKLSGN